MNPSDQNNQNPVEKVGGWVRLNSRLVYENPWIRVSHEEVKTPNGTDGIYGVVHFKGTAVGVVPIDQEGYTWLVRQSRYTLNEFTWEIPEGGAKPQEPTLDCAQRELAEEVGLQAGRWRELMRLHLSNSVTDESAVVYVATELSPCEQNLDATEDIEVRRLPLREAIDMALAGEITDAISVAALLRLALEQPR
jgi:8-oxo-dGTP pyrophosphatase MutT (NUDIX family)